MIDHEEFIQTKFVKSIWSEKRRHAMSSAKGKRKAGRLLELSVLLILNFRCLNPALKTWTFILFSLHAYCSVCVFIFFISYSDGEFGREKKLKVKEELIRGNIMNQILNAGGNLCMEYLVVLCVSSFLRLLLKLNTHTHTQITEKSVGRKCAYRIFF